MNKFKTAIIFSATVFAGSLAMAHTIAGNKYAFEFVIGGTVNKLSILQDLTTPGKLITTATCYLAEPVSVTVEAAALIDENARTVTNPTPAISPRKYDSTGRRWCTANIPRRTLYFTKSQRGFFVTNDPLHAGGMEWVFVEGALSENTAQVPNASVEFVERCRTDLECELSLFQELSKLLRPSKEEYPVADYILKLKEVAEKNIWKMKIPSVQDKIGNLVIYLPATGKFQNRRLPSMALQAHMDMVLAHKSAKPDEKDLRPYFKNGVSLVTTGDLIHSKNRLSTIGADNGIGVAMALRYLLDPTLEHRPLELVFTVREEIGLAGALAMEIPLKSRELINLDGMTYDPKTIITASQGASRSLGNGQLPSESESLNAVRVRVSIANLAGGHSGGDIHLKRLNGVRGVAHILSHLQAQFIGLKIVSVVVGNSGALNKIPSSFMAEISLPSEEFKPFHLKEIENDITALVRQHTDDNLQGFTVSIKQLPSVPQALVLESQAGVKLVNSILEAPNGVLEQDVAYPNNILTSSNLGSFEITPASGYFYVLIGSMSRSFKQSSLIKTVTDIQEGLKAAFNNSRIMFKDGGSYPSWAAHPHSRLLARAMSLKKYFQKTTPTTVGIEPSVFAEKYPQMDIISFSPVIRNAHTTNEELSISSTRETVEALQSLLALDEE